MPSRTVPRRSDQSEQVNGLPTLAMSLWLSVTFLVFCVVYVAWHILGKPGGREKPIEQSHTVTICNDVITHRRPDGMTEQVPLSSLVVVVIETNDLGPLSTDCFWILIGEENDGVRQGCYIPSGATGESELLTTLQGLPGFDNHQLIEAMSSTQCQKTIVWERSPSSRSIRDKG